MTRPAGWPEVGAGLRVGFAGTPEFASTALRALVDAGFTVPLVLTQPDRPAGRGMKLQASPVKQFALEQGLTVAQPRSLRLDGKFPDEAALGQAALHAAQLDLLVVAAYGLILPAWVLATPRFGCLNIHGSLLPRWRGAAPIHRAIEAGDAETGITIMQMDEGLDTGDMLLVQALPIAAEDTTATLHDRLAALGAQLMVQALQQPEHWLRQVQPEAGVCYAHKIDKVEAALDWTLPAATLARRVRAFDPFPGCTWVLNGETVKLWQAQAVPGQGTPGQVLVADAQTGEFTVACGEGALRLQVLQRTGGRRRPAADFLRGWPLTPGAVLG